jgi:hypothetical protein
MSKLTRNPNISHLLIADSTTATMRARYDDITGFFESVIFTDSLEKSPP